MVYDVKSSVSSGTPGIRMKSSAGSKFRAIASNTARAVARIHVGIDEHDRLGERQLAGAHQAERGLLAFLREAILDRDHEQVVEPGLEVRPQVADLGMDHVQHAGEHFLHRLAHELVFLRRLADHARLEHRLAPVRHRAARERRETARRASSARSDRRTVLRARRSSGVTTPSITNSASAGTRIASVARARQARRRAAQEARERELVDALGKRRDRGEQRRGIRADRDRDLERLAAFLGDVKVETAALADLPVHAGRAIVVHVHAIDAEIARVRRRDPR